MPAQLASAISERLHIPTIGIGAGVGCDGQVQIWHDLLGAYTDFLPRHAKRYANLAEIIGAALRSYAAEVRAGEFPTAQHSSSMDEQDLQEALGQDGQASPSDDRPPTDRRLTTDSLFLSMPVFSPGGRKPVTIKPAAAGYRPR